MYCKQDETHRSARDVRANLSALCHAKEATVILDRAQPTAILVPIDTKGLYHVTPKDRRFAAAKKRFRAALDRLRTQ